MIGSKVIFSYGDYNFNLEGYLVRSSGNVNIYHNDDLLHSGVPLYREENNFSCFYSSRELDEGIHRITIVNCNENPVYISKLYYKILPPSSSFTVSTPFSNSESFTKSLLFSSSESFTTSLSFSNSEIFTKSISFANSECFSISSFFSESIEFRPANLTEKFSSSISFSSSHSFTTSHSFSFSDSFSHSNAFSPSSDLPNQAGSRGKSGTTNIIIGVCVAILAVIVIILIIVFLYLRNRKQSKNESNTIHETDASVMNITGMTNNEDADSPVNSMNNDLFADKIMSYEEDQNDFGNQNISETDSFYIYYAIVKENLIFIMNCLFPKN